MGDNNGPFPGLGNYQGGLGFGKGAEILGDTNQIIRLYRTFYFRVIVGLSKQNDNIIACFVAAAQEYQRVKRELQELAKRHGIYDVSPEEATKQYQRFSKQFPDKGLAMVKFNEIEEYYLNEMINDPEFRQTLYTEDLPYYWEAHKPDEVTEEQWKSLLKKVTPDKQNIANLEAWNENWDNLTKEMDKQEPWLQELYQNTNPEDWKAMSPGRSAEKLMIEYYESYRPESKDGITRQGISLQEAIVIKMITDYYTTSRKRRKILAKNMRRIDLKDNYINPFKRLVKDLLELQKPLKTNSGKEFLETYENLLEPEYDKKNIRRVFNLPVKSQEEAWEAFGTLWKTPPFLRSYASSRNRLDNENTPVR